MKPRLFGSSGIRGLVNIDITQELAMDIGRALGTLNREGKFIIGKDSRTTGPILERSLSSGLITCGGEAISIGLVPTPVVAWMVNRKNADAGVAISASHNSPEYNGLKIFNKKGMSLTEKEQINIEKILDKKEFYQKSWRELGSKKLEDGRLEYKEFITKIFQFKQKWRIACDCFCGAAGPLVSEIFKELDVESHVINAQPDGHFPAGNPEPNLDNLKPLGKFTKITGSDLGLAFDGDADRMMILDQNGDLASPDRLLSAYAALRVKEYGGGIVVTHVGTSMNMEDMVEEAGGKVVRTKVGDANITEMMQEVAAIFGGEPVGAWVHPEVHMCPDGILSALKILNSLDCGITLSDLIKKVPEYPIERKKVECPDRKKYQVMKGIEEHYNEYFDSISVNKIDGVRIETEEGWLLIRPSGTEPLIRITVEGKDDSSLSNLLRKAEDLVATTIEEKP
jgi:phosphoglucosamine mutase